MSEDNKENIPVVFKAVNISNSVKVLVLGGGNAAGIKYRSFDKKGFQIDIYSDEITDEYILKSLGFKGAEFEVAEANVSEDNGIKKRISDWKNVNFKDYVLIVIATDNDEFNNMCREKCMELNKLFIYCSDFRKGNLSVPMEIETEAVTASISTKMGSPETARFLSGKIEDMLSEYDGFVKYVVDLRRSIKDSMRKKEVMRFVNSDDFYFFYTRGKSNLVLRMFYGDDIFEDNSGD